MAADSAASAPDRPDAFISYSRRDKEFVEACIAAVLEARGKDLWIDVDDIRGGASDWRATVWAGIEASRVVVFVLSPDSLASRVCGEELAQAVALNKRVIPVLRRPVDGLPVPDVLARPNWILAREEDDLDSAIAALTAAIETDEAWLGLHARLTQRTAEWLRADRDASYLLRGSDLRAAEQWLEEQGAHAQSPTTDQIAYIVAGRKAAAKRQRVLLGGVLLALGVSVALGIVANTQRRSAESQALAAQAIDAARRDPEAALRLAIEAAELRDSPLVARALREAVAAAGWTRLLRADPPGAVNDVDLSRDGQRAVTASENGSASVWDVRSGRRVATLRHARGAVNSAQFSPDGRRVVTAGQDGTARLWDAEGRALRVFGSGGANVASAAFDERGGRIISATDHGDAQVWELARRIPPLRLEGGADDYGSLTPFSPDGRHAVTAGAGGTVRVWTLSRRTQKPVDLRPPGIDEAVTTMTYDPDGRRIAVGYSGGSVCLWTLGGARPTSRCTMQANTITDAKFSGDGAHFVTASTDGTAVVHATASGRKIATLDHDAPVNGASFDPRGGRVLTAGDDRVARIWTLGGTELRSLRGHTDAVVAARFSHDGRRVLTGSDDGAAAVWTPGADVARLPEGPLREADVAISPDSRLLLAVDQAGRALVWDRQRQEPTELRGAMMSNEEELAPCDRYTGCAPWSADSASVAGVDRHGRATIWNARTGAARPLGLHRATGAGFSPDGRLAVLGAGSVRLADAASGRIFTTLPSRAGVATVSVGFTADGARMLTVGDDGSVELWDARRGTRIGPRARADVPAAAAVSADGAWLAVGADTGELRVYDVRRGAVRTVEQHVDPIMTVAFDRSGRRIVAASEDRTASVWALERLNAPQAVLRGHAERLRSAEFSPDGRFVLTAGFGGSARLWDPRLESTVLELPKSRRGAARFSPDGRFIALGGADTVELHRCVVCAPPAVLAAVARGRVAQG